MQHIMDEFQNKVSEMGRAALAAATTDDERKAIQYGLLTGAIDTIYVNFVGDRSLFIASISAYAATCWDEFKKQDAAS